MLKQAIQDMFAQAGCNTPATRSMLGDSGVSEANLMIYLGIIEQRTNEILQVLLGPHFLLMQTSCFRANALAAIPYLSHCLDESHDIPLAVSLIGCRAGR